jgi:hypothetical protein
LGTGGVFFSGFITEGTEVGSLCASLRVVYGFRDADARL